MRGRRILFLVIPWLIGGRCPAAHGDDASALAAALAAPPTPRSALALVDLLGSRDGSVRTAAAASLGRFGAAAEVAVPALVDLVAAGDAAAAAAVASLGQIARPSDREEVEAVLRARLAAGHADAVFVLLRVGVVDASLYDVLVTLATTADGEQRLAAVRALVPLSKSRPALADALAAFLEDRDLAVRATAVNGLRWHPVHGPRAQARDVRALDDPSPTVRVLVLEGIADRGILSKAELPDVVALLADPDPDVRAAAATAVASTGPYARPYVAALAGLASDPEGRVRRAAVQALIHIGSNSDEIPAALSRFATDVDPSIRRDLVAWRRKRATGAQTLAPIEQGLGDPDAGVRQAAVESAGTLTPLPEAILSRLAELLRDVEPGVRREAVAVYGSSVLPERDRIAAIVPLLSDASDAVRAAACEALDGMPSYDPTPDLPLLVAVLDRAEDDRAAVMRLIARAGPAGVDALLDRLRGDTSSEWRGRPFLLGALAVAAPSQLERVDVRRAVLQFWGATDLLAEDALARLRAAVRRAPEEIHAALLAADDDSVAWDLAALLATAGPEGVRLLVEAVREEGDVVPRAVREALGQVPVESVWPIARRMLDDEDARARVAGVEALAEAKGEWSVPAAARVAAAVRDGDWRVRNAAARAFQGRPLTPDALDALASLLSDRFADVREEAYWTLSSQGRDARAAVPSALARLRGGVDAKELATLVHLLGAIAARSDAAVATLLLEGLADPEPQVAAAARSVIGSLRPTDPRVVPALAALLERGAARVEAARTLGLYGPAARSALPALERAALSPSADLRQAAMVALPSVRGDTRVFVGLLANELSRRTSLTSIEELGGLGPAAAAALPTLRGMLDVPRTYDRPVLEATREAVRRIEAPERK